MPFIIRNKDTGEAWKLKNKKFPKYYALKQHASSGRTCMPTWKLVGCETEQEFKDMLIEVVGNPPPKPSWNGPNGPEREQMWTVYWKWLNDYRSLEETLKEFYLKVEPIWEVVEI